MLKQISMSDDKITILQGIADQGLLLNVRGSPTDAHYRAAFGLQLPTCNCN